MINDDNSLPVIIFSGEAKAFEAIRKAVDSGEAQGRTQWSFLGRAVCVAAWKRLHGLGSLSKLCCRLNVEMKLQQRYHFVDFDLSTWLIDN